MRSWVGWQSSSASDVERVREGSEDDWPPALYGRVAGGQIARQEQSVLDRQAAETTLVELEAELARIEPSRGDQSQGK